jgi:hypothetical protein
MVRQRNTQGEEFRRAQEDFNEAWRDVENTVVKLRETVERAREALLGVVPHMTGDPNNWRALDPFLYLEELMVDAGRVVDEARPKLFTYKKG